MVKIRLQKIVLSLFFLAGITHIMASNTVSTNDTLNVVEEERKELGLLQLVTPTSPATEATTEANTIVEQTPQALSLLDSLRLISYTPQSMSSSKANRYNMQLIELQGDSLYVDSLSYANDTYLQRQVEIANLEISPAAKKILLDAENAPANRFDSYNTYADCDIPSGLFMPTVFSKGSVAASSSAAKRAKSLNTKQKESPYALATTTDALSHDMELQAIRGGAKAQVAADSPWLMKYAESALPEAPSQEVIERRSSSVLRMDKKKPQELKTLNMGLPKISYWKGVFTSNVQLSQLSLSDNWYQGGVGNLNLTSSQNYNISYDDQNKVKFSANVLWKLGLNSAPDDTIRSYYLNEDQFRIESAYSIQAYERWYYNVSLLFNTQLFNNYTSNTDDKVSSFMSPTQLNVGLGMLYSYTNKAKTFTCSATMSPLALDIYFVVDTVGINYSNLSLDEGETYMQSVGTNLEYKMTWKIMSDLSWTTRFFVFTDYDYIQSDLENTLTFAVSRYFSTTIFLHLRYDDSVDTTTISPWQTKEQIGFGFNYTL